MHTFSGHNLSQKLPETSAKSITKQLVVVNGEYLVERLCSMSEIAERWEDVREKAMRRQRRLQEQLNALQRAALRAIANWLQRIETHIESHASIADTTDEAREQMAAHAHLQCEIEAQQSSIAK